MDCIPDKNRQKFKAVRTVKAHALKKISSAITTGYFITPNEREPHSRRNKTMSHAGILNKYISLYQQLEKLRFELNII